MFVCNLVARTQLVKATTAIENAAFVTMQWLASVKPSSGLLYTLAEELKSQVKKMGGFFQLLIQVNTKMTVCINGHAVTLYCAFCGICIIFVQKLVEKSMKSELTNDFHFSVFFFDTGFLIKMHSINWRVLALSCLSSVYGNDQAEGICNLEPQTEHEYMENKSKFLTSLST